jgi:molybdate transport system substrate-binding protein
LRTTLSLIRDSLLLSTSLTLLCGCGNHPAPPQSISVAAAADLQFALDDLSRQFQVSHPQAEVKTVYGSSGNFYSQIQGGAPFDVFLSADVDYPRKLAQQGFAQPDSIFTYAVGRIAVWAPADSPLDPAQSQMRTLEAPSVKHIAIANPAHAPYGRAAEAALRSMGLYDRVAGKLVLGENIAQTLQFVQSGAADVGIVALSLALAPTVRGHGRYWEIPVGQYPRIEQGGAILTHAKNLQLARDFCAFLKSPAARGMLKQYGFSEE